MSLPMSKGPPSMPLAEPPDALWCIHALRKKDGPVSMEKGTGNVDMMATGLTMCRFVHVSNNMCFPHLME